MCDKQKKPRGGRGGGSRRGGLESTRSDDGDGGRKSDEGRVVMRTRATGSEKEVELEDERCQRREGRREEKSNKKKSRGRNMCDTRVKKERGMGAERRGHK